MASKSVDVLVVGAGASGIACGLALLENAKLSFTIVEQTSESGGVWRYEANPPNHKLVFDRIGQPMIQCDGPNPTPMYDDLMTNKRDSPVDLMSFHDDEIPSATTERFQHRTKIETYLHRRANKDEVKDCTMYNTKLCQLGYSTSTLTKGRKWTAQVESTFNEKESSSIECDFVFLSNGHYRKPYVPNIEGLSSWKGQIFHSQFFRHPQQFDDKVVAIIGIGPTGYDIARQVAQHRLRTGCSKPIYSVANHESKLGWAWNDSRAPSWTRRIESIPRICRIQKNRLELEMGHEALDGQVDMLIFATGYLFSFPFCDTSTEPWATYPLTKPPPRPQSREHGTSDGDQSLFEVVAEKYEGGLRMHHLDSLQTFYYPDPSVAFAALNFSIVPFPLAEHQARAAVARWSGQATLPLQPFEGSEDEDRSTHILMPLGEYELQNRLLASIGEGDADSGWRRVPAWKYELRKNAKDDKIRLLGY